MNAKEREKLYRKIEDGEHIGPAWEIALQLLAVIEDLEEEITALKKEKK